MAGLEGVKKMASEKGRLFKKSQWGLISQVLVSSSIIAILLAGVGYLGTDIWLASTQWLIVAGVLAALGVYAKLES